MKRLTSVVNQTSIGANISTYSYGYSDATHRDARSFMESTVGAGPLRHVNYAYDEIGQLTSEVSTDAAPQWRNNWYSQDAMGNRTAAFISWGNATYSANKLNQLTRYTYNNLPTDRTYAAAGNTQTVSGTVYGHDDMNRLTSVTNPGRELTLDNPNQLQYTVHCSQ